MGPDWDAENPHERSEQKPKLSWAGRLDGHVNGRPVSLVVENRDLILVADKIRTLFTLRRSWRATVRPLRVLLERADVRLLVRVGWLGRMEVFPNPSFLIRLFLPRG